MVGTELKRISSLTNSTSPAIRVSIAGGFFYLILFSEPNNFIFSMVFSRTASIAVAWIVMAGLAFLLIQIIRMSYVYVLYLVR